MKIVRFEFRQPLSGSVDHQAKLITGVAVMTGGLEARGHKLQIDDKTIEQVVELGKKAGKVQVKYDHRSGVTAIGGYLFNFRVSGNKALADWQLLETHEETEKTLEKAEKMPECFGLSAAFNGPEAGEKIGKKNFARCTSLEAVDCVTSPAANPTGLFEAKVDNSGGENTTTMPKTSAAKPAAAAQQQSSEPATLDDVLAAVQGLTTQVSDLGSRLQGVEEFVESNSPMSQEQLDELNALSDDELAAQGVTRAEVTAAIEAIGQASAPGGPDGGRVAPAAKPGEASQAVSQEASVAMSTAKRALDAVIRFETKQKTEAQKREDAEAKHAFETLENKLTELSELNTNLETENTALRAQLRRQGGRAAAPSTETTRLFSANSADKAGTFEGRVTHFFDTATKAGKPIARSQAVRLAMSEDPEGHRAWLDRANGRGE